MLRLMRTLRYRLWLFGHWLAVIASPRLRQFSSRLKHNFLAAVGLVALLVPLLAYLWPEHPDHRAFAEDTTGGEAGAIKRPQLLSEMPAPSQSDMGAMAPVAQESALDHAQKHMDPKFVCPMHPEIISENAEDTCPICGMDLVPLTMTGDADVVELSSMVINALGVRTKPVKRRTIFRRINSVGSIMPDETKIRTVTLRTEGWVERLVVKSVGERVKQGDLLFEVYAPTLVNAQEEFIQALEQDDGEGNLTAASEKRLRALGVSQTQIDKLREDKQVEQLIQIYAPQDGIISELTIREGMFVPPSKPVISLADLSSIWLVADIFESQVDWVKTGQLAEATLSFMPDKVWEGEVEYIYPSLDAKTRSLRVRLRFDNPGELLKPNMYADVTIFASPKRKVLTVPREAVIRIGNQARVITARGDGRFKPVVIHAGIETDELVEVIGGVEEGREVVVSSQFLIDSESSMRAALARMSAN